MYFAWWWCDSLPGFFLPKIQRFLEKRFNNFNMLKK